MTASYLWLPHDLVREVPALFIDSLRGLSGMVARECDGIAEHARLENPSDHPVTALETYIEKAEAFEKLMEETATELRDKLYHARALLKSDQFQGAIKADEEEAAPRVETPEEKAFLDAL